jgi:succinate dehydrogenase / fumarate reductase flavoprotein subunit
LGAILEIYEMFVGDDPRYVPMRIFPGVHYSMGGLWVDFEQRTNIPGLFAAGECDYSIHGANRLGANSLVSCVYGGFTAAPSAIEYARNVERGRTETNGIYDAELKRQQEINDQIIKNEGPENQYKLHEEMGKVMTDNVTVVRYNDRLMETDSKLLELQERFHKISINDSNLWATQALPHARQLWNMLQVARVITLGALNRNESRGAHYKPDFPERNDEEWLKTTVAEYADEAPVLSYEAVDVSLVEPRKRDYSKGKTKAAQVPQPGSEMTPKGREEIWVEQGKVKEGESFKNVDNEK